MQSIMGTDAANEQRQGDLEKLFRGAGWWENKHSARIKYTIHYNHLLDINKRTLKSESVSAIWIEDSRVSQ